MKWPHQPKATFVLYRAGFHQNDETTPAFDFRHVPPPARTGTAGKFTVVDGKADGHGAGPDILNDGRMPTEEDQPEENFFFDAGTPGGRLCLDLNEVKTVEQLNAEWKDDLKKKIEAAAAGGA
jgi:hypothetical protein